MTSTVYGTSDVTAAAAAKRDGLCVHWTWSDTGNESEQRCSWCDKVFPDEIELLRDQTLLLDVYASE